MLKLWLVTFRNGEEWHIFGEKKEVEDAAMKYRLDWEPITFVRAYRR